ncbi:MAG: helix-turn-helix domain-containing protein [Sporichthyaceae bacterium]
MDVPGLIADCRREVGLSLRELARRAGTSHSSLSAYEAGTKNPSVATLERIIKAAGFELAIGVRPIRGPEQPFPDDRGLILRDLLRLGDHYPLERSATLDFPVIARL